MILNTGNRTDIPAFYGEWFMNRIRAGFVYSRNPYYPDLVTSYKLDPLVVDIIAFCSKNPIPFLKYIDELKDYRLFFMVTITPYGQEIEPHVPNKNRVMDSVKVLSQKLGPKAVTWRYDPIFINEKYTVDYHIRIFKQMCERLSGYVDTCIISFIDLYAKTRRNFPGVEEVSMKDQMRLAKAFQEICESYHIHLKTCLEDNSYLRALNIDVSGCMTKETLERAFDLTLKIPHLTDARKGCHCLLGNDIGTYNTCGHGCLYCYANEDHDQVKRLMQEHDPLSPLLIGHVQKTDLIRIAKQESYIERQISLFDL